eukprot:TRINITY_DN96591_c0_g1_i1.p1 TRINITY_DN96591_c0_g1~~TRINITY_DN96591_c0_g1_i1.p1  ORF type:complete len:282 (-),score=54.42 TRINITY_DN96591_c0_g1_i1:53-898(-)
MAKKHMPEGPKWTMREKPKMIIGGEVPSWKESIPGPKYAYDTNHFKERQPVFSMRTKPEMVIGGSVPSWTNSIPGPKYVTNVDSFKPRQPVFSMPGRGKAMVDEAAKKGRESAPEIGVDEMKKGLDASKHKPPAASIKSRTKMVPGAPVPSWVASIPGPKYSVPVDSFKEKRPVYSIGKRLPTEGELMSTRSPGPVAYSGAAMDAKKQAEVDSTKQKSFSCSFGIGSRFDGPTAEMLRSGALARFDKPTGSALKATAKLMNRANMAQTTSTKMNRTQSTHF